MAFDPTLVRRVSQDPIVAPDSVPGYGPIFNAGLVHHDGRYHLFARAVRNGYRRNLAGHPRFLDYVSDIVVFTSDDGHRYDFGYVLAQPGPGVEALEDPRVQWVRSEGATRLVMTYTHMPAPVANKPWRIGAGMLDYDGSRFEVIDATTALLGPDGVANKDAVIFNLADGRVALIHRIHPNVQLAVFDSLHDLWTADAAYWTGYLAALGDHVIIEPTVGALGVGAGAPPIATKDGHILFFHEREASGRYTTKVALLDAVSGRVRGVAADPILVPELSWERDGDVDNVVFVQGAHLRSDGSVYLTYGAADRCVGAATLDLDHVRSHLDIPAA